MATVTVSYAIDMRYLSFAGLYANDGATTSTTLLRVFHASGATEEYRGAGFGFTPFGQWNAGTVTSLTQIYAGARMFQVAGLRLAANKISSAAVTSTGVDDLNLLLGGNDVVTGGRFIDYLLGHTGNDVVRGMAGADVVNGGPGNDVVSGGIGIDKVAGAAGNDVFFFDVVPSSANYDVIVDFANASGNNDSFRLENAYMPRLGAGVHALNPAFFRAGAVALDSNDCIIYNRATGLLAYDTNGNAAGGVIPLAVLSSKPVLTAADFFVV